RSAAATAAAGARLMPPSENESGVTLTTPITAGRGKRSTRDTPCIFALMGGVTLVSAARAAAVVAKTPGSGRGSAGAWANVLAEIPLFAPVSSRPLRKIASLGTIVRFEPGSRIVQAGQDGDAFFVVLDGKGSVARRRGLSDVKIGAGAYFGEMAL